MITTQVTFEKRSVETVVRMMLPTDLLMSYCNYENYKSMNICIGLYTWVKTKCDTATLKVVEV